MRQKCCLSNDAQRCLPRHQGTCVSGNAARSSSASILGLCVSDNHKEHTDFFTLSLAFANFECLVKGSNPHSSYDPSVMRDH